MRNSFPRVEPGDRRAIDARSSSSVGIYGYNSDVYQRRTRIDHRWDRHPSDHNTREHVHPGPDAPTLGTDTSHPADWRDILSVVLSEIEDRQRAFWEE